MYIIQSLNSKWLFVLQVKVFSLLQVAFNNQAGGSIRIGSSVDSLPSTEGSVITKNFPFAASENNGVEVQIQLNGSNPNAQIIYVLKAQP